MISTTGSPIRSSTPTRALEVFHPIRPFAGILNLWIVRVTHETQPSHSHS